MITLADAAREFARSVILTDAQLAAFDLYYRELVEWNARMNLTAIIEHDQVVVKHFLDSLSVVPILLRVIARSGATKQSQNDDSEIASSQRALLAMTGQVRLIDIGTGAGFPGIPLKIVFPDLRLTLLETTGKKVEFLKHMIAELHLSDTMAIQARAEDLGRDEQHRAQYDVAVARAVAKLATLSEYALPFVRTGGVFIAQKGVDVDEEVRVATHALKILGGRVREIVPVQLPGLALRHIIVIEKISATPNTFPRRAGTPERQPIS